MMYFGISLIMCSKFLVLFLGSGLSEKEVISFWNKEEWE